MPVPKNVITTRTTAADKPILDAIKRDKAKEAKERKAIERGMKRAAKGVRTGR